MQKKKNEYTTKFATQVQMDTQIKQTQNEIIVTGPVTSNNSLLLNNKENSLGINGSEQSKLNEAEDYNMKEISGIMKSILED